MDWLGQKLSRIISICVVSGCLSCGVYGDETISSRTTTAKTIDVSASNQELKFDSGGYLEVTNSTNAVNFTGTGTGKTFAITNGSSVDPDSDDEAKKHWLISATNAADGICNASAIDLTGICGDTANGVFTISLPTTDKTYSFSASAEPADSAAVTFATVIGVPQAPSNPINYVTVDTNGGQAKLKFEATATGGTVHSGTAVFGTGHADGKGTLTNWTIGNVGAGSELTATATGSKDSYSTIFGAGRANGTVDFNTWTIGNIGKNSKLTSQSEYSTIFGAGYAYFSSSSGKLNFANWNIGNIGANASLESKSSLSGGASSIVGPAYAKSTTAAAESLDFSGLHHDGVSAGVTMTSEAAGGYSTVFGAGYAEGSVGVKNWTIGTIGGTAEGAAATTLSSKGKYSSVFGAGRAYLNKTNVMLDFSGWKIGNLDQNGNPVTGVGNNVTITSEGEYATIFGAGQAYLINGTAINFSNWSIGAIGANANFTSTSSSSNVPSYSSIFGAGYGSGDFRGWTIGAIGANANFTSTSSSSVDFCCSSIFGAGYGSGDFRGWTIGAIGANANFTSISLSSSSSADSFSSSCSSIFGAGYGSGDVSNWTVEFQGNAVVAGLGYATNSANCHISTFGGYVNGGSAVSDGMRFYFNGKQQTNPVVMIGALKLANAWTVSGGTATAAIAGGENGQNDARAFGIGQNFQINVGRERELADTKQNNGTLETLDSITSGGKSSSAVTMNILGEIRAAEGNGNKVQTGSVMRIDGGSTVNCFRPVQNIETIAIINGTMNLMGDNTEDKAKLTEALQHLQANISYSRAVTEDVEENGQTVKKTKTELYQNDCDKTIALGGSTQKRDGRDGNVALNVADGGYPINGTLTIGSGQTLVFGVDLTKNEDGNLSMFKKTNGVLHVPNTGQHLVLDGGMLAIRDSNNTGEIDKVPAHTNFYVVRTNYNANITPSDPGFLSLMESGYQIAKSQEVVEGCDEKHKHVQLYRITTSDGASIISTDNDEYTYWDGLHAYLINDPNIGAGIVIGTGAVRMIENDNLATKKPTDYTKDFASEELASIDVDILSDIRDQVINMELCGDGQDPFIMVIGGHGHQDEILGYGYDYDKYGIVIGHDFIKELSNGGNLKFGGAIGYCHANIDFFGNATSRSKHAGKDMYNVGIFGMYKNDNSKHMHTRFHIFGGFAYVENEMSRVDGNNAHFNTKFDSNDINVSAEFTKGMVRLCGLEVGPWAGVTYNRIHQKSYHENGGRNAASLDAVDFDMLDTILGLHAEKIFLHKEDDKKYLHLVLRAGWKCQPIRSHSHCLARLDDAGIAPFVPVFGYADKHSGILYGGLKNKISDNISISGGIGSTISHDHWNISGHIALNYYY